MAFQFDYSAATPVLVGVFVMYLLSKWYGAATYKLKHIPTVGSSNIILSYLDGYRFIRHGHEMIQEGYNKHYGSAFKVATMGGWMVLVSGPQMTDDIRRATEEQMSFDEAIGDVMQTDYTVGRPIRVDNYHAGIVRSPLTRNIGARFSDINDEVEASFRELIPVDGQKWTKVHALSTIIKIVCRVSNRYFVGLPLCRNPEYLELNEKFTIQVFVGAQLINSFPKILKPLVGRLFTQVPGSIKRALCLVEPVMEAQLEQEKLHGPDWADRPNNLISWLLDEAKTRGKTVTDLVIRLLAINFGAIHTSSNAFTHALYNLAAYPEYIAPMREEVEAIIEDEGWTKASLGKMHKLDSFIKETLRTSMESFAVNRKMMKDFTFSNGMTLPAGFQVSVATRATHMDERNYENPHEFKGFRFAEMRDGQDKGPNQHIVSINPEFLPFGTGRNACPGRFFAANELKSMLIYVLLNYDVKLAQDGPRPESYWSHGRESPSPTAELMFRKRSAQ